MEEEIFFKVICEEVDAFGKNVYEDTNKGSLDEVHEFVKKHIMDHPTAKWELYLMPKCTMA